MTLAIVISSVLLALVLALGVALPSIADPTVPFGVRIPAQHLGDPAVARQTRLYRWRVLGSGVIAGAVGVAVFAVTGAPLMLPLSVLLLVGAWYACFLLANHALRAAKAAGGWYAGTRQGIAVDTELRTRPPRFPWRWLAPAALIVVVSAVVGLSLYPSMPTTLAVHFGAGGAPDRLAAKTVGTAFALVFLQLGVTGLLAGIAAAIFHSRADIDPARPAGSARWFREYLVLSAKAVLALAAAIDVGLLGASLLMWTGTVVRWAPLVVVVPVLAGVLATVVVLARHNRGPDPQPDGDTGLVHRDDDRLWHGGLVYANRQDHALFVPRRFGIGWTINVGNPRAGILLAGIAGLIALVVVLRFGG